MMDVLRHPNTNHAHSYAPVALAWLHHYLPHPTRPGQYYDQVGMPAPIIDFFFDALATDTTGTKTLHDELVLVLPKKCAKSLYGAALVLLTAFGPSQPDGIATGGETYDHGSFHYTYAPGEVMATTNPGASQRIMAVSKDQATDTCFHYVWVWCGGGGPDTNYSDRLVTDFRLSQRDHVGKLKLTTPTGGVARVIAADQADEAADGGREILAIIEEGHRIKGPIKKTAATIRNNIIAMEGRTFCPTTAHALGEESYLEDVFALVKAIRAGETPKKSLLFHHAYPDPALDLTTEDGLRQALAEAYVAAPWRDADRLVEEFYDPRADVNDLKRLYLGIPTSPTTRWLAYDTISKQTVPPRDVARTAVIGLGGDASRGVTDTADYLADATVLIGCAAPAAPSDPYYVWPVRLWVPTSTAWTLDHHQLDTAVTDAFNTWTVRGFYCDPPMIEGLVAEWERRYRRQLKARATTRAKPIAWWTNRLRDMSTLVQEYEDAFHAGDIQLANDPTLIAHHVNAFRRPTRTGYVIGKERYHSNNKMDAAIGSVLAWAACRDAIREGAHTRRPGRRTGIHAV